MHNLYNKIRTFVDEFEKDQETKLSSTKEYYKLIVKDIPENIEAMLPNDYLVTGSAGKGQKTKYPWVCMFNPKITKTAQKGIYMVMLFKRDLSGFYLTLGQGITNFELKYKKHKYEYAKKVAEYFRSEVQSDTFSLSDINLISKKGDLGYGYEQTSIISKYYPLDALDAHNFEEDLNELRVVYDDIYENMKPDNYDTVIERVINDTVNTLLPADEAEAIINKALLKEANTDTLEVKTLEEVPVPNAPKKSYTKIRTGKIKKTDYINKAIKDSETGLEGEKLVLAFEKQRLRDIGLEDHISKIDWTSQASDQDGFDIVSYDLIDGEPVKIYIEVKTTVKGKYESFYLSENELQQSRKYNKLYWIYRVYDLNTPDPKLYCVNGSVEDNFNLNAYSHQVSLKYCN